MYSIFILLTYILLSYAFSNLLLYFNGPFNIIDKFRNMMSRISDGAAELFRCRACNSTWVGFILSAINIIFISSIPFTPFNLLFNGHVNDLWWLIIMLDGVFTSGTTWLMFVLEDYLTKNIEQTDDNDNNTEIKVDIEDE